MEHKKITDVRMKTILVAFISALFIVSCVPGTKNPDQAYNDSITVKDENREDSVDQYVPGNKLAGQIVFGVYCGFCAKNCATMFRFDNTGNNMTLMVDSTDSYFKNDGIIRFSTMVTDINRIDLAHSIMGQIPTELLTTAKDTARYGCPDCTDGCGIYFELTQNNKVKKFYIDNQTSQLTGEIKIFAEYLKSIIAQLKNKQ